MAEDLIQLIIWPEGDKNALHKSVSLNASVGEVAEHLAHELDLPKTDFWGKKRLRYTLQLRHSNEPLPHNLSIEKLRLRRGSQLTVIGYPESETGDNAMGPALLHGALVLQGGNSERFPFEKAINVIGRSGGQLPVDINLEGVDRGAEGYRVSRNHAELRYSDGRWLLRLLDARNRTFVDGTEIADGVEVPVADGSIISIAQESPIRLRVELG